MIRRSIFRLGAPLLVAAVVGGACSSSSSTASSASSAQPGGGSSNTTVALASATLNGSGSTLQKTYEEAAISAFTKDHSSVTINYNGVGSGQGQTELEGQTTDFAGSDVPVAAADVSKFKGGAVLHFPIVAGPITVPFKLSGVKTVQLSGDTLAKIFARTIKTWNDPAIVADNVGTTLPSTNITVVHRSDSSGTTAGFTSFLMKAGGASWTLGSNKSVNWSPDTSAGKGSAGVISVLSKTEGAIGYVDLSDAKSSDLNYASIKNASGKFVAPTLEAASAALAATTAKDDLTLDPINQSGEAAYPITSATYILAYAKQTDPAKGAALKAYLSFILSPAGQALAADNDYAKLSTDLATKAAAQVDKISVG